MNLENSWSSEIRSILSHHFASISGVKVLLFGSYAKGVANETSDIDLAIIYPGKLPLSLWAKVEESLENSDIPKKVDLVDYSRISGDFRQIIDRDGIEFFTSEKSQK